jgi:hypothetical protein
MALDVYVGTLTRYYRREWENAAQRMARAQGVKYQVVYPGGEAEPPAPAEEVRHAVAEWCESLSLALEPHGVGPVLLDEGSRRPYFTERPAWAGYASLLIWAAHAEHPDLPIPAEGSQSWKEDPAYQRSTDREFKSRFRTLLEPELWLPTEFPFVFEAPTPVSEKTCIGSVFTLKQQLDDLHQLTGARLLELKAATHGEPAPTKKTDSQRRGTKERQPQPPSASLCELAEFGLTMFRDLATKACDRRLPMLLDH